MNVEYSYHPTRGKAQPHQTGKLGTGWETIETTVEDMWQLITVDGLATSCALLNGERKASNFSSRQVFMIDIDGGMSIQQLKRNTFYNQYAWGYYVTPSHTEDNPRFRIVFISEFPVSDYGNCGSVINSLQLMFQESDKACKDPVRLFYGTPDCQNLEVMGNIIESNNVYSMIAYDQKLRIFKTPQQHYNYTGQDIPRRIDQILLSMGPGDRSDKACQVGGIAGKMNLPYDIKLEIECRLKIIGCDDRALRSFRQYARFESFDT